MDREIKKARFVLMICTPTYYRRVMGEEEPGKGLGIRWEGGLIYQHLYNSGSINSKFLPILIRPDHAEYIPTPIQGATHYCISLQDDYESLYSRLIGRTPTPRPPLGKRRALSPKNVKTDVAMFVSMPINIELWDKAIWCGVYFSISAYQPPLLGLLFREQEPARQIFREWHDRFGPRDDFEELRISIIEGDIPGELPGYTVHIGADWENVTHRYKQFGFDASRDLLFSISRLHRMNPEPDSQYLQAFKQMYRTHKTYLLAPGVVNSTGRQLKQQFPELGIVKGRIHFRRFEDIGSDDQDSVVLEHNGIDQNCDS